MQVPVEEYGWHIFIGAVFLVFMYQTSLYVPVIDLFGEYGWYILIAGVLLVYIYLYILKDRIGNYRKTKAEQEYAAKYHKNPDLFAARVAAQQQYVNKLQEKYEKEAEEHQRKMEEKRAKKLEEYKNQLLNSKDKVYVLGNGKNEPGNSSFKPEYHPLMGSGSSSNYRAPRRSPCGGGGCGR